MVKTMLKVVVNCLSPALTPVKTDWLLLCIETLSCLPGETRRWLCHQAPLPLKPSPFSFLSRRPLSPAGPLSLGWDRVKETVPAPPLASPLSAPRPSLLGSPGACRMQWAMQSQRGLIQLLHAQRCGWTESIRPPVTASQKIRQSVLDGVGALEPSLDSVSL